MMQIEKDGIRTRDGQFYKVDAIVCATGFDCSFRPAFPVIGRNGKDLRDVWQEIPVHYMSVAVPGFPNYFSKSPECVERALAWEAKLICAP